MRYSAENGIPYEFYRLLDLRYNRDKRQNREALNILLILSKLYSDIETYGIVKGTNFNLGWMCPVHKKGDKAQISTYRPVTLLNNDYKLRMKSYTLRLTNIAPSLVHPDQAGFMKVRRIEDQVKLAKFLLHYAEAVEDDGVLISLDQEKRMTESTTSTY
jgi:hypothetical protein